MIKTNQELYPFQKRNDEMRHEITIARKYRRQVNRSCSVSQWPEKEMSILIRYFEMYNLFTLFRNSPRIFFNIKVWEGSQQFFSFIAVGVYFKNILIEEGRHKIYSFQQNRMVFVWIDSCCLRFGRRQFHSLPVIGTLMNY